MATEPTDTRKAITADLRHPVLEMSDKMQAVADVIYSGPAFHGDTALGDIISRLFAANHDLHYHLNAHYKWD